MITLRSSASHLFIVLAACLLITGGAILAAWPMLTSGNKQADGASP